MGHVLVIGGGPSGMMAAMAAADRGHDVTILERNEKLGKKLYITGKGRCNVTNASTGEEFLANVPRNPRFLYSALSELDSVGLMEFLEGLGVPLTVERGRRVFPTSMKSSDIIRALERGLRARNVGVRLNTRVARLTENNGRITGVVTENGEEISADAVITATGGMSYRPTGSTGDGYGFAESAGHTVTRLTPSLVPIDTRDTWIPTLQGISLKNVVLKASWGKRGKFEEMGEMLFAHFGITGPLVLSLSSVIDPDAVASTTAYIDLKPALDREQLHARILRELEERKNQEVFHALGSLMPVRVMEVLLKLAEVPKTKPGNQLTQKERDRIVDMLKGLPVHLMGLRGWDEAVITRGGIPVKEIDPKTMASRKKKGLAFAGEIMDVDGFTGGYNLQIAFSTGYCAGAHILEDEGE